MTFERCPEIICHPGTGLPAGVTDVTGVLVGSVTDGGTGGSGEAGGAGGPGMGVVGVPALLDAVACAHRNLQWLSPNPLHKYIISVSI